MLPWVDVATGSLGQGLPDGVGVALAGKYLDRLPYRIWVLCGDSELAEGSIWEAFDKASYYELSNLIAIVDVNRLGQRGETELGWNLDAYARRAKAFGARTLVIDGHDLAAIDGALTKIEQTRGRKPTYSWQRLSKGAVSLKSRTAQTGMASHFHLRWPTVRSPNSAAFATWQCAARARLQFVPRKKPSKSVETEVQLPHYPVGEKVATRQAYGDALVALGGRDPLVVALDGEVSNSTYAIEFAHAYPDRYFEMFIAEQQLVAAATGLSTRGYRPFASTFAAFLTRAYDFIRMGSISAVDLRLVGSHCGVEIGADGPSQMGLEDMAMFRAVHGSTVLYPADATSTVALVNAMADIPGISYLVQLEARIPCYTHKEKIFRSEAQRRSAPANTTMSL